MMTDTHALARVFGRTRYVVRAKAQKANKELDGGRQTFGQLVVPDSTPADSNVVPVREARVGGANFPNDFADRAWAHLEQELQLNGATPKELLERIRGAERSPAYVRRQNTELYRAFEHAYSIRGCMDSPEKGAAFLSEIWSGERSTGRSRATTSKNLTRISLKLVIVYGDPAKDTYDKAALARHVAGLEYLRSIGLPPGELCALSEKPGEDIANWAKKYRLANPSAKSAAPEKPSVSSSEDADRQPTPPSPELNVALVQITGHDVQIIRSSAVPMAWDLERGWMAIIDAVQQQTHDDGQPLSQ